VALPPKGRQANPNRGRQIVVTREDERPRHAVIARHPHQVRQPAAGYQRLEIRCIAVIGDDGFSELRDEAGVTSELVALWPDHVPAQAEIQSQARG